MESHHVVRSVDAPSRGRSPRYRPFCAGRRATPAGKPILPPDRLSQPRRYRSARLHHRKAWTQPATKQGQRPEHLLAARYGLAAPATRESPSQCYARPPVLAAQAALLTAVNAGARAFLGGVRGCLAEDPVLSTGWGHGLTASAAVTQYGGQLVDQLGANHPTLAIGAADSSFGKPVLTPDLARVDRRSRGVPRPPARRTRGQRARRRRFLGARRVRNVSTQDGPRPRRSPQHWTVAVAAGPRLEARRSHRPRTRIPASRGMAARPRAPRPGVRMDARHAAVRATERPTRRASSTSTASSAETPPRNCS